MVEGKLVLASVLELADQAAALAGKAHLANGAERLTFTVPATGLDYIAVFSQFPTSFQKPWKAVIIAPLDDFVGNLKHTNRNILIMIIVFVAIKIILIFFLTNRFAKPTH